MNMIPVPLRITGNLLLVLLAVCTILLAPVAAFSHAGPEGVVAAAVDAGDCHSGGAAQHDDCCETSACACACHAPLATSIAVPLPATVPLVFALQDAPELPQVYLSIFVPPQNRS